MRKVALLLFLLSAAPTAAQSPSAPAQTTVAPAESAGPIDASANPGARGPVRSAARLPAPPAPAWSAPGGRARPGDVAAGRASRAVPAPLLVGAGILGGGIGLLGGGYAGAQTGDWQCQNQGGGECDGPVVFGALMGAVAGEALLLPLAEHFVGGRRGPLLAEIGASVSLAAAGLGLLYATRYDAPAAPVILVGVPLAQLGVVTWLESRRRE